MYNNDDIMAKLEVLVAQNELLEAKIEKSHIQADGLKAQNDLLTDAEEVEMPKKATATIKIKAVEPLAEEGTENA